METSTPRPSDRWIPWILAAFYISFIIPLAIFTWLAIHTYTGQVTDDAYKKGLAYNATIAQAEAQAKLGWKGVIATRADHDTMLVFFTLKDKAGKPVEQAQVAARLTRSTQAGHDKELALTHMGQGLYQGSIALDLSGQWQVRISATSGSDHYQLSQVATMP